MEDKQVTPPSISVVIPCYNEEETVEEFYRRISVMALELPEYAWEFIFVNDGSSDATSQILNGLASSDWRVKVLHIARNQGHQIAITAGLDFSSGDITVTIDADLQDPPEVIPMLLARVLSGFDIVHAQRISRCGESIFKRASARLFYKLMYCLISNEFIENCGDYRAFTRSVLLVSRRFRERHRYLRGIFATIGFRQSIVQYARDPRFAGVTKYPFAKMTRLAINAVLSFSSSPIRTISWCSFFLWGVSLVYLCKALYDHFVLKITVPGWTSIVFLQFLFTGIILFCLGIIGTYVGRIFEQSQNRPLYWLADTRNIQKLPVTDQMDL